MLSKTDPKKVAQFIDHTLLRPEASRSQIEQICAEAVEYQFCTVCVNPTYAELCSRILKGSGVLVCTVNGFPLGAAVSSVKALEADQAIRDGAAEVDMVINVGALKSGDLALVESDIRSVVDVCHPEGVRLKVIIEAALLSDAEKVLACQLAVSAGADYVKTSTGFGPGGATVADVMLMRQTVGPHIGVKAAGGIRTLRDALTMLEAGANRIGASSSVQIAREAQRSA
jgi:deoxyribose-phosphate aldolase